MLLKLREIAIFRPCSVKYPILNDCLHLINKDKKEEWRHKDRELKEVMN